jgi:phosphoribosylformimino-5-aminoimidazole carboxamide ribotide isomerase
MKIIPAIDIIEGKCVRLEKGDYSTKKIYNENPLEIAKKFEGSGIKYLHLVDLDGAKSQSIVNWKVLENIANKTNLIIDFGGGLKSNKDVEIAFSCGAIQITGGSIAVKDPDTFDGWIQNYGGKKIILGADVKNEMISTNGWLETSDLNIFDFLENYLNKGLSDVICTDISKDGMLQGTSKELYKNLIDRFENINLIASGGVDSMDELFELKELNLYGAIVGKAIYENKIDIDELAKNIEKLD